MTALSTEEQAALVESSIKSISHIATLPEITLKIIGLVEDSSSTAQDLHDVIANDPALCSRVLKVVNSAFYGLPRQIGSINRAIVLLGLNAVKNIAIAASLSKLFKGGDLCPQFSARDLWTHSIASAAASKLICDELRLGLPDEAFLAGLIHDIGIMVELQSHSDQLVEVFTSIEFDEDGVPQTSMRELEDAVIGADHQLFGAGLCEAWKFPKSFTYVTGHHHDPMGLPQSNRTLAAVVYVADRVTMSIPGSFKADLFDSDLDHAVLDELGMTATHVAAVIERVPQAIEEVEGLFSSAAAA